MAVTNEEINAWLAANPTATDQQIASKMQQFGVTPEQMATATGAGLTDVTNRYNSALGITAPPQGGTPYQPPAYVQPTLLNLGGGGGGGHYNQPTYAAPTFDGTYTASPYLGDMAGNITNRVNTQLGDWLNQIQGHSVGVGGLGGSRQGIAQGEATGNAADMLAGQLANLYGTDYTNAMNRNLQRYGVDVGSATSRYGADAGAAASMYGADASSDAARYAAGLNYNLGLGNQATQRYGYDQNYALGLGNLGLNTQNSMQNFYTSQRGQDLSQMQLGMNLYNSGNSGYMGQGSGLTNLGTQANNAQWQPINNANSIYGNYTGFGNTSTTGTTGGGAYGTIGGALAGSQLGNLWSTQPTGYGSVPGGYTYGGQTYNNPSAYTYIP